MTRQCHAPQWDVTPMEIKGPSRIESTSVRRVSKGASASTGAFHVSETPEQPHNTALAAPGPLAAVDTILMLQNVDDSTTGPSRGVARGEQLLDLLDSVRDGLLAGGIPRTTLNRLATAVGRRQEKFSDPRLQSVLDEIELRAHVELAKLEQAERRVA